MSMCGKLSTLDGSASLLKSTQNFTFSNLRPFGMIYSNRKALYIATDKRKNVYSDLVGNPQIEMASYNMNTRKWIRVNGKAEVENSMMIRDEMINKYPLLKQKFFAETEMFLSFSNCLLTKLVFIRQGGL